ncbi:MAG: DUF2924 domain-containing protein [Paracoccaceae bacterium]
MTTVAEIEGMDRAALSLLWRRLIGGAVPPRMSQPVLRQLLAFELQVQKHGGLAAAERARLARIATKQSLPPPRPTLKPGARLLRTWNGVTHVVEVTPEGYLWNGSRQRSLSAIARAITGTRWSGPRFFGLGESAPLAGGRDRQKAAKVQKPRMRTA